MGLPPPPTSLTAPFAPRAASGHEEGVELEALVAVLQGLRAQLAADAPLGADGEPSDREGRGTSLPRFLLTSLLGGLFRRLTQAPANDGDEDDDVPEGKWVLGARAPGDLLRHFAPLRLQAGFRLVGAQQRSMGGHVSSVWATPDSAPVSTPDSWPKPAHFRDRPRPPDGRERFMQAIEGDDSPWSYLAASIFFRLASELNATWHHVPWSFRSLLGPESPIPLGVNAGAQWAYTVVGSKDPAAWQWCGDGPLPISWRPTLTRLPHGVLVTFYTYTPYWGEQVHRIEDLYAGPGYDFRTCETVVARGGPGIMV